MARPVNARVIPTRHAPALSRPLPLHAVAAKPRRRRKPRMFYAALSVGVVLLVMTGQVLLSVSLQSGAYEIAGLQRQVKDLGRAHQSATEDMNRLGSPQNLARNAENMGMVNNSSPAYLRLSTGAVTGQAQPARAGSTVYPVGDQVPNERLVEVFAEQAAARAAQVATTSTTATTPSPGVVTSPPGASSDQTVTATVPSQVGIPAPATH